MEAVVATDGIDQERLLGLLGEVQEQRANTRPVSVSLPEPLIEALRMLSQAGLIPSTSAAATAELERVARNLALRLELDALYAEHPDLRPSEAEVEATIERNRRKQGAA